MSLPFYYDMLDEMSREEMLEFQNTIKSLNKEEKKEFIKQKYKSFKEKTWDGKLDDLDIWIEEIFQGG